MDKAAPGEIASVHMNNRDTHEGRSVISLADELVSGMLIIVELDDAAYINTASGSGSISGHMRHNLDFINRFLAGVDDGRIDYTARERDVMVETDRQYAIDKYAITTTRLRRLPPRILGRSVLVRSEVDPDSWHPSSLSRELEFVHSHTIHHSALIGHKLAKSNVVVSGGFGVAPSTIRYWKKAA